MAVFDNFQVTKMCHGRKNELEGRSLAMSLLKCHMKFSIFLFQACFSDME